MTATAPLYPYQRRWIADASPLKAGKWCRSAGKTHAVMLEPVIDCQLAEVEQRRVSWFCFSGAEGQTKEMLRYAGTHARAISIAVKMFDEEIEVDGARATQHIVEFPGGSRIVGLPSNPLSIRGRHGNLIWDEAGKTPHDEEIWAAASPIASRKGFKVRLVGTPGPRRGPFYRIFSGEMKGWELHEVDIHQAIAEGAPLDIEKIRAMSTSRAWVTEYLCQFEDEDARLLSLEQIIACEDEETLVVPQLFIDAPSSTTASTSWKAFVDREQEPHPSEGYDSTRAWARLFEPLKGRELYLGYDVARSGHLSVLWIVEPDGLLRRTRAVIALRGRRFAEQRACLWAAIALCRRACIDATGIGNQLAEETLERFGEGVVEKVMFNGAVKEDLAVRLVRGYEDRAHRIPRSNAVRESMNAVYKVTTAAGHSRYDADSTDEAGHADYFWSQGLAAGDGISGPPVIDSFGERTFGRDGGIF